MRKYLEVLSMVAILVAIFGAFMTSMYWIFYFASAEAQNVLDYGLTSGAF